MSKEHISPFPSDISPWMILSNGIEQIKMEDDSEQNRPGPPRVAYSSIGRLFSQSAALDSNPHPSRKAGQFTAIDEFAAYTDPITVLSNLMLTLKEFHVPGPRLLRLKTEFTLHLGHGAQFEVFGFDNKALVDRGLDPNHLPDPIENLNKIAIKRSRAIGSRRKSSTSPGSEEFVFQCSAAHREIDALCQKPFRSHPNIVKLLAWGLCLDTLENDEESPRIPLLILERATCNLYQFMSAPITYHPKLNYNDLRSICLDIGRGLDAIHDQSMAHGDLKPENVLIFESYGRWIAKLCDFGLSATESQDSGWRTYHGTPGWRPPEYHTQEQNPLTVRDHQKCDVYAFGLVVWSVFRHGGRSPLSEEDELHGNALDMATKQITKYQTIPKHQHRRIILTVQGALPLDPGSRMHHPWKFLDSRAYQRVGKRMKIWRELATRTHTFRHAIYDFTSWSQKLHFGLSCGLSNIFCCLPGWQKIHDDDDIIIAQKAQKLASRNSAYRKTFESYKHLDRNAEMDSILPLRHPSQGCFALKDMRKLHDDLVEAIRNSNDDLIYALSRLRSRFYACCWLRVRNGRPVNIIKKLVQGRHEFDSLAWLCRGEIGNYELSKGGSETIFYCTYTRPSAFTYISIRRETLNAQQRAERFLLFLEHGGPIEAQVNALGETIFLKFLQLSNEFAKNGYGDLSVKDICASFKRISRKSSILPSTRFYMTGALPEMEEDMVGCTTTALHDSVIAGNYTAVESLMRSGFFVNAVNQDNKTALQLALQGQPITRTGQPANKTISYRIIALLQQNSFDTVDIATMAIKDPELPLGWDKKFLKARSRNSPSIKIFYDLLSTSSTFIQPNFSLYEDRRLALGARRFSASGQTYYLDLIRFLSPSTDHEPEFQVEMEIYDDDWYENEPQNLHDLPPTPITRPLTPKDLPLIRAERRKISGRSLSFSINRLFGTR